MSFQMTTSWKEIGLQMQTVKDKCNDIITRLSLPDDDVRVVGMKHVRQFCNTIAIIAIKLQQNAQYKNNVPIIMTLLGMKDVKSLESCLNDLNPNSKTSYITMCQFALENCIERILDSIPGEKATGRFKDSIEKLITITGIPNPAKKLEIVLVPAWIRNCLHAGGIHTKSSKTVTVDGEKYVFEKGKRLDCGSWSHIFHSILNALHVYDELFFTKIVSNMTYIGAIP